MTWKIQFSQTLICYGFQCKIPTTLHHPPSPSPPTFRIGVHQLPVLRYTDQTNHFLLLEPQIWLLKRHFLAITTIDPICQITITMTMTTTIIMIKLPQYLMYVMSKHESSKVPKTSCKRVLQLPKWSPSWPGTEYWHIGSVFGEILWRAIYVRLWMYQLIRKNCWTPLESLSFPFSRW